MCFLKIHKFLVDISDFFDIIKSETYKEAVMLNIAVCDDNSSFAEVLMKNVKDVCNLALPERIEYSTAPLFNKADDVLGYLERYPINILFLDIDMPGVNGFRLAEGLCEKYPEILIIFVSSHDDYVYSSFEYSPFRFIRKSKIGEELKPVLLKAIDKLIKGNETILLNTTDGDRVFRLNEILYLEADLNYFAVQTAAKRPVRCRGSLGNVEAMLEGKNFFRVSQTYIVNEEYIDSYSSERFLKMKNGKSIEISTRKMVAFKRSYLAFVRSKATTL